MIIFHKNESYLHKINSHFPTKPNFLLTDEEKKHKGSIIALTTENSDSILYFDITKLITYSHIRKNVTGIQRVVFEFAKYINDVKFIRFFYIDQFDNKAYYLENFNIKNESDLSIMKSILFLNVKKWHHSSFIKLLKIYLQKVAHFKEKNVKKIILVTSLPIVKYLFIYLSKLYLKSRFPAPNEIKSEPISTLKKKSIVAIFGVSWNQELTSHYKKFFEQNKANAFFINYLHDVIPLIKKNLVIAKAKKEFKVYLKYLLQNSHLIITSTNNNINDLQYVANKYYPNLIVPKTVACGLFYGFNENKTQSTNLRIDVGMVTEQIFVLCVGSIDLRKNHHILFQAWRKFINSNEYNGEILVIAGSWFKEVESLKKMLFYSGNFDGSVIFIENPSDIELLTLYKHCKFTVYPSLYEGWGLPISESIYFGKPVIHFRNSCLTEVSVGVAYVVDNCQNLEQGLKDLFGNDDIYNKYCLRLNSIKKSLPNIEDFSERILTQVHNNNFSQ